MAQCMYIIRFDDLCLGVEAVEAAIDDDSYRVMFRVGKLSCKLSVSLF